MSRPSAGLIWMVASREIWFSQTDAVSRTSVTAPKVRHDRKVMMAMTSTRARPAMFWAGTMGAILRWARGFATASSAAKRATKRRARSAMSTRRARSGGKVMGKTFSR